MTTDALYDLAAKHGHAVHEVELNRCKSMSVQYNDGTCAIALDAHLSEAEKRTKLSHELGHCERNAFYTRSSAVDNRPKCESSASRWAIKKLLPFREMRAAMRKGYTDEYSLAEYFNVTQEFVRQAFEYYTAACGYCFEN